MRAFRDGRDVRLIDSGCDAPNANAGVVITGVATNALVVQLRDHSVCPSRDQTGWKLSAKTYLDALGG